MNDKIQSSFTSAIWHLYVVECSDGSLYTGITTNVDRRVSQHSAGKGAKYTRSRKPVKLITSWEIGNRSEASKAEYAFKQNTRKEKLRLLTEEKWSDI